VFCFAHAGGDAGAFLDWQPRLGADAELVAVRAAGGPHRGGTAPSIDEFADGAAAAISAAARDDDRPIYLFGHSLGALIAFEVARRLADLPALRRLVASGCSAPPLMPSKRLMEVAKLEGKALAEAIGFLGGLPLEVLADEELRDLLLPRLMADMRMAVGYRFRPAPPLTVGISLINGRDDPHVGIGVLRAWADVCSTPPAYHWADGGHFYFERQPAAVVEVLRDAVRADQHVELI
jgi:surfactin synthase thioesterase subunit